MDWTITQQGTPPLVVVRVSGFFTFEGCRSAVEEIVRIKDPLTPLLFDDREVDFSGVDSDVLLAMNDLLAAHAGTFAYSKMAMLMGSERDREIADQWRRLANTSNRANVAVFTSEPEALDWLTSTE